MPQCWMNLKNTTLSERSQTRKAAHRSAPLYEMSRMGEFIGAKGRREGGGAGLFNGYRVFFFLW